MKEPSLAATIVGLEVDQESWSVLRSLVAGECLCSAVPLAAVTILGTL